MQAQVSRWGNSMAVRLPKAVVDALGWQEGDNIEFTQMENTLSLKRARNIKRRPLKDVLASFHTAQEEPYIDWGLPVGKEIL